MAFFDIGFAQGIVSTLLGALLGIPVALWIDRRIQQRKGAQEREELKTVTSESLSKNLRLVEQLQTEMMDKTWIPSYPLDLTILDATAHRKYEILQSVHVCRAIDHARYELVHLDRKLDQIRSLLGPSQTSTLVGNAAAQLHGSCSAHLPIVNRAIRDALQSLGIETPSPSTAPSDANVVTAASGSSGGPGAQN